MDHKLTPLMMDAETRRAAIRTKVIEGITEAYPVVSRNKTLEIKDVSIEEKNYSPSQQKMAILKGDSLFEPVKGTVTMRDKDGKVIDQMKNFTLARIPWYTPRHTLIVGGNEYSISNQVRPKPGVYARKRANGVLEANFNTRGGKNFNVILDAEKGIPALEYGTSTIPLYPILRGTGLTHEQISNAWGKPLADKNQELLTKSSDKVIEKLYTKVIPDFHRTTTLDSKGKIDAVFASYGKSQLDPYITEKTLGKPYTHVTNHSLLDASKKVITIFKNTGETDDRDNLDFKTMYGVEDFFKEVIGLNARDIGRKTAIKMESTPELKKAMAPGPFTAGILKFINSSQLAAIPTQTNPMELIDASMRVTAMGEGGIGSERAIPMEARQVHATQIGALDPFRTPESFRAGVDVRAAMGVKKDEAGNIHVPLIDVHTKKVVYVRAGVLKTEIIAFPDQILTGHVDALVNGELQSVPASKVKYQLPNPAMSYSPTTNLVPFMNSLQGNRVVMGSKMQTQALSLIDREAPYIQTKSPTGHSFEHHMATLLNPQSQVAGTVKKIDGDFIYIQPDHNKTAAAADLIKVPYETYFPLAAKTYLHHDLQVKVGDKVSAGQILADSNFTRDGKLALGKNLSVAYMPYYGANSNDAIVISEGAAKKLTSSRMYKMVIPIDPDVVLSKNQHQSYFGHAYTSHQYSQLDKNGVVLPGTRIMPTDPIFLGLRKSQVSSDDLILGRLHKSLAKPYREFAQKWDHDHAGIVVDVVPMPKRITITIRTEEPMVVGDKMAGRAGNKGVVAQIVPDAQMIHDESGKPIDVLMTSAGIVSRTNPGILLETALGKVVEKTGKPILVEGITGSRDNVAWAKGLLKEHGIKDKETVYDPIANKKIPNVFVGRQYILKLMKSTDTNYSARSTGSYDVNQQPTKGGATSSKAIGKMEFDALIAHNARNVLREASTIKSQKNDEFWKAVQLGYPTPPPKTAFAYDKFLSMLTAAGVRSTRNNSKLSLSPLSDADVSAMSSGEILNPTIVRAKDLKPEEGGLFDIAKTGGLNGTRWTHIQLVEPIVNPTFREPVRRLLNMTEAQLTAVLASGGGEEVKKLLKEIDLDKKEKELFALTKTRKADGLDDVVKQLKYIRALRKLKMTPDQAYIVTKVPVLPPVYRPIIPGRGGQEILYGDLNPLYRDLLFVNAQAKEAKASKLLPDEIKKVRVTLNAAVGAVYGMDDPITAKSRARGHKGVFTYIAGVTSPKEGYFQSKLMKRTQDVAGRGTIVPDSTLGMDQVGIPEDMLWTMYEKFLIKDLVSRGFPAIEAAKLVKDKHPTARESLLKETQNRPLMINRAPTLHRGSLIGAYPIAVPGKTIRVNPFAESGMNADYDGDSADCYLDTLQNGEYVRLHIREFPRLQESVKVTGNKEVYEVPKGIKVYGYSEMQRKVVLCDVTAFSVHHDLDMVEVVTESGRTVRVSQDHSMFGLNVETGELQRFKAEEGIGWPVPRARKLYTDTVLSSLKLQNTEQHNNVSLDVDLGWLIGSWAGNGWVSAGRDNRPSQIGLSGVEPKLREEFTRLADKYFPGASVRTYGEMHDFEGHRCYSEKTHINSRSAARTFFEIVQECRGALTKRLPSYFVQAPREFQLGLLAGLIDTDGTVSLVKAKAKNKPQYLCSYTTGSEQLADEVAVLCTILGIKTGIHPYAKKERDNVYYVITLSTPDLQKIALEIPCKHPGKKANLEAIAVADFDLTAGVNSRWDLVPIASDTAKQLQKLNGNPRTPKTDDANLIKAARATQVRYMSLINAAKHQRLTRTAFQEMRKVFGDELLIDIGGKAWFDHVTNEDILWDFVQEVTPLPDKQTAWDLTVPDGNTFMTSNQLIVYDTMMIHVPVGDKAVDEVRGMTLSNLLFGDQRRKDLMVFPQHEAIMGLAHASTQDEKNKPVHFKNKAEAMAAYTAGKITLGTNVVIGDGSGK